jgi:hypothetical protein
LRIFSNAAFEWLTGIDQRQMEHYAVGHSKAKIELALYALKS